MIRILRSVEGATVEVVTLDATLAEQLDFALEPTEHAIEDGSVITDHAIKKPRVVTVTGLITNYPIRILTGGIIPQRNNARRKTAYDALVALIENKVERVAIVDELDTHTSMLLTSLSIPRDGVNYNGLRFTAVFKRVRVVSTVEVEIAADDPIANAPADVGTVTPTAATAQQEDRGSYLIQAYKALVGQ